MLVAQEKKNNVGTRHGFWVADFNGDMTSYICIQAHPHSKDQTYRSHRSPWKRWIYFIFNIMRNGFCFSKPTGKVQLNWRYRWNELKHGFLPQITTKENLLVTSFKWIVLDEWHKYMFRDNNASHLQDWAAVYHWSGKSLGNLLIK